MTLATRAALVVIFATASSLACRGQDSVKARSGPLPDGVVARVGETRIEASSVARVAQAQGLPVEGALDAVVSDALLAREAQARGLAGTPSVRLSWEVELARRTLKGLLAAARATPPTSDELAAAASRRWLEVDRPEGFRTVHAAVLFAPADPEEKKARGRALAAKLRTTVQPAVTAALDAQVAPDAPAPGARIGPQNDPDPLSSAFRLAALGVHEDGLEVRVEPLPAVSREGRILEPGDHYVEEAFSRVAASLGARGTLSAVTETSFGAHVILLLERTPAKVLVGTARVNRLTDDIVNERARAAQKRLLADRRTSAEVAPDAVGLLALVRVEE